MEQNTTSHAWSGWSFAPNSAATQVFQNSLGKLLGVTYKLIASNSQAVSGASGTIYAFLCMAETTSLSGNDYIVMASVYQPTEGKTHIVSISAEGPKPARMPGGWDNWQIALTPEATSVFDTATKNMMGVGYKAIAFATQLVAGTNYAFVCEATPAVLNAAPYPVLIQVYQPLEGAPVIESINAFSTVVPFNGVAAEAV